MTQKTRNLLYALLVVLFGFILAQEKTVEQKPPIDDHLIKFHFPRAKEKVFDNGLTVLVIEHHEVPKVYYRLGFDFGEKNDAEGLEGSVELMSRVIKKGTENRSYEELSEEIDFVGGTLEITSTVDFFYVSGEFISEHADVGLELISDVVINPIFPPEEIEKERNKLIADLENEKSSPSFLADRRLKKVLFAPHPYSRYKTTASLQKIDRTVLMEMHKSFMVPAKTTLVIAGDITYDDAIANARKYFSTWRSRESKLMKFPPPRERERREVFIVDRPGSAQSNLLLGNLLFSRKSPQYEKVLVMNKILGGGASGRLFLNLREEKGYTYGAYSSLKTYKDTGAWTANAEVRTPVTDSALVAFFDEFSRIKNEPVPEEDLKNAKRYLIGVFPLQNETPSSIAYLILQQKLYDLPENYWDNYLHDIDRVTGEDVQAMAREYIQDDRMAVVIVGDAKEIETKVSRFGPVRVFDVEDKRIK